MMSVGEYASIGLTVSSTVLGAYVAVKVAIAKLETRQELMEKDIDSIAEFIGTPRAIARKKEFEQNQKQGAEK